MYARDFRARARAALKGHWGTAIAVALVAAILAGSNPMFSRDRLLSEQLFRLPGRLYRSELLSQLADAVPAGHSAGGGIAAGPGHRRLH